MRAPEGISCCKLWPNDPLRDRRLDEIYAIEQRRPDQSWPRDYFSEQLDSPHARIFIAYDFKKNRLVGYLLAHVAADEATIVTFVVSQDNRRRGIGRILLKEAINVLNIDESIAFITLEVRPSNIAAYKLYEDSGFIERGRRKAYYQDDLEDAVLMRKDL